MSEPEVLHPLRPILKNWVWEHGRVGTRYLDCTDGEIKFDDGKKARYASESIFYVPLGTDDHGSADEAGPAIHEGALARFLRAAQLGKPEEAGSVADVQRAAQDCVELGLICAYQEDAQRALARYALEPMFEDEIRVAVVADVRAKYLGLRAQLALYDFTVFHGLPSPLLISEAPFIDWRVRAQPVQPFVTLPARAVFPAGGYTLGQEEPGRPGPLETRERHGAVQGSQPPPCRARAPMAGGDVGRPTRRCAGALRCQRRGQTGSREPLNRGRETFDQALSSVRATCSSTNPKVARTANVVARVEIAS